MDYFSLGGDRYDKERLQVIRERGDKYEEPGGVINYNAEGDKA
jgi:hypothetical protein